ncbi:MAG: COX15/CtaA family protein [Pseudomonadota bacterium]
MAKGVVFEEVGASPREASTTPAPGPARRGDSASARAAIAAWLWGLAALVALMVLIGGMTRLTDSGLAITVWEPVMGAIPPLSDADWEAAFQAYKTTTEFQEQNDWMTLADFKPLYWWEWGHRQFGRLIGLVWAVGLGVFLVRRMVPRGWTPRLILPGVLGGLQGAIGWWMVSSGLVGRLDVASYRLALHLGLAFVIFGLLVWLALRIRLDEKALLQARRRRADGPSGIGLLSVFAVFAFLQILVGALVAGIDAGRGYVDWPLMQGHFLPPESFDLVPFWRNFFENPALVQFVHRMLGYLVLGMGLWTAWRLWGLRRPGLRFAGPLLGLAVLGQTVLGIVTVVHAAAPGIAIWHQGGALVLAALVVWAAYLLRFPPEQRIARA